MKTSADPRHQKRIQIVKDLFARSFLDKQKFHAETQLIIPHIPEIDELLTKAAPQWPLDKVAKVDLAILRLAVYELIIEKKEPSKVIIDEAVELAKEFGGEESSAFVNGVLGTILKTL